MNPKKNETDGAKAKLERLYKDLDKVSKKPKFYVRHFLLHQACIKLSIPPPSGRGGGINKMV